MPPAQQPDKTNSWGPRLEEWVKRNALFVIVSLAAVVVAAVVTLAGFGAGMVHWYQSTYEWRDAEYARLESLRAGFTLAQFEHKLGAPLFSVPVKTTSRRATNLTEDTFRGRDYWVQTDSEGHGTVVLYAVTSCSSSFTPSFGVPGDADQEAHVILNRSVPDSILRGPDRTTIYADYFTGNTADSYFYDEWYGANPGFYKTFFWGLNDACPDWLRMTTRLEHEGLLPQYGERHSEGDVEEGGSSVMRFRQLVPINTFAETAPGHNAFDYKHHSLRIRMDPRVHVGVDRNLIRTVMAAQ